MRSPPLSIGLFAGAFGLDLGLEQAGFQTVSLVENEPDAVKTIALNRPHLTESAIPRDIRQVDAATLLAEGGRVLNLSRPLHPGEVDLVTGGPPCQPFSTAGKRGSVGDPRGSLFMDFIRLIEGIQPRFFIMENVRGLLSAPIRHRSHNQRGTGFSPLEPDEKAGSALQVVLTEMRRIGYQINYGLLNAADYGVPQVRQRVIFIGSREGEAVTLPQPTHHREGLQGLPHWRTLKDALANLQEDAPEYVPYSESRLQYLRLLKAGQNWRNLPPELQPAAMGGAYHSGGGKVGFYRRLAWDEPAPTITTSPHQKATDMCHPEALRPLSIRECQAIQTFPQDWIFHGSLTSKYRQIGNAVPVLLAKAIGDRMYNLLQGEQSGGRLEYHQLSLFPL
ncbi:DNA cytosine methyltransferase [Geitlerinema splendidum]|nr:DNA cytosine methyltransferase [Geitlerinema splendidum]